MDYSKLIGSADNGPIYQQITRNIASWVQEGQLLPGDKLPTERELADLLSVSRGTVSRAYEQLERMELIESTPGRGTIISPRQDVVALSRKDRAIHILQDAFREIGRLRFTNREVITMAQLVFMEMESNKAIINAAAVDCNPESLAVLAEKLRYLSRIKFYPFDLNRVLDDPGAEEKLKEYDLVITTTTHGIDIERALPTLLSRIIKVPMNPSRQTIIDLSGIHSDAAIGVFTESQRFFDIITKQLSSFQLAAPTRLKPGMGKEALENIDLIILPPSDPGGAETGMAVEIARFKEEGGRSFVFEYQIDRETLNYIEERVKDLLGEE